MSVRPITPAVAKKKKSSHIPDFVIETFNDLIVKNMRHDSSRVTQKEAVEALVRKMMVSTSNSLDEDSDSKVTLFTNQIFDEGYLDVEPIFREAGWDVEYDKPGYNESYGAYFIFTKKD